MAHTRSPKFIVIKHMIIIMYSLGLIVGLIFILIGLSLLLASNMIPRSSELPPEYDNKNYGFDAELQNNSPATIKFSKFYFFL
jgi:hypothetical protein